MVERKVDYIIVGQGIAGSWLAYELNNRGYDVMVYNHETDNTSSKKAAGLFNPITGKKMVKTWMADQLFDNLEHNYSELEKTLGSQFLHSMSIYRPFNTIAQKNDWELKIAEEGYLNYIKKVVSNSIKYKDVLDELGGVILKKTGYVNLTELISSFRNYLLNKGQYQSEMFDYKELALGGEKVVYKNVEAKKILFCEGPSLTNPFWEQLPFKLVRGELMDIECDLESNHIINRGVFMIPKDGYFTIGSTYDHTTLSFKPQKEGIMILKQRLSKLYSGSFRIKNKRAGIRPATFDRKPFIGLHPNNETLGIFNGFGTKGVSMTPYFASHFVDYLEGKTTIVKEADVQRVF